MGQIHYSKKYYRFAIEFYRNKKQTRMFFNGTKKEIEQICNAFNKSLKSHKEYVANKSGSYVITIVFCLLYFKIVIGSLKNPTLNLNEIYITTIVFSVILSLVLISLIINVIRELLGIKYSFDDNNLNTMSLSVEDESKKIKDSIIR